MQTRTRNLNSLTRVIAASALVALVAGQALAAKPDAAPATTRPGARPRISFPKPTPKPDAGSEYDKPDLWAKTVVTTFANFNEPNAKLVLNAEIMNVGTQDFQGSRVIWLVATPKGGNPVVLAKKTITSLKKGKLYTFGVDQPKWMKADTALSLSIDPGDFNPGNDTWDPSKEPPVK